MIHTGLYYFGLFSFICRQLILFYIFCHSWLCFAFFVLICVKKPKASHKKLKPKENVSKITTL